MEDIKWLLDKHQETHRQFCPECGGLKKVRTHVTGSLDLDWTKCTVCNGHGTPQPSKRSILENLKNKQHKINNQL